MAKKDEEFAKELQMKEVVEAENAEEAERMHTTNHNA